jgi:hypothetical protein
MITVQDPKTPGVPAPQVVPWAPSTTPVAMVNVVVQRDESTSRTLINLIPLGASGERIPFDPKGVPQAAVTAAQTTAFLAQLSIAGETFDADLCRRALPLVEVCFGLSGYVTPAPPSARLPVDQRVQEAMARVIAKRDLRSAKAETRVARNPQKPPITKR